MNLGVLRYCAYTAEPQSKEPQRVSFAKLANLGVTRGTKAYTAKSHKEAKNRRERNR